MQLHSVVSPDSQVTVTHRQMLWGRSELVSLSNYPGLPDNTIVQIPTGCGWNSYSQAEYSRVTRLIKGVIVTQ